MAYNMMKEPAKPQTTILQMKKKLCKKNGIPLHEAQLYFNNVHLQDKFDLQHYNIQNGASLTLKRFKSPVACTCAVCERMRQTVTVTVTGLGLSNSITLETKLSETVESLKKEISKKSGVPVAKQRLTVRSKPGAAMEDYKPLAYYEMADEESGVHTVTLCVDPGTPSVYNKFLSLVPCSTTPATA